MCEYLSLLNIKSSIFQNNYMKKKNLKTVERGINAEK